MTAADHVFDQDTVAFRLRTKRIACGLSQRQLACPGVSYAYVSRLEAGVRTPSTKAIRKLAARFRELGFDCTPEWLETGRHPVVVRGPLTERLTRDLMLQAQLAGIKQRRPVQIMLIEESR